MKKLLIFLSLSLFVLPFVTSCEDLNVFGEVIDDTLDMKIDDDYLWEKTRSDNFIADSKTYHMSEYPKKFIGTKSSLHGNTLTIKDDDAIVNIVPKKLFVTNGSFSYIGKEYAFFIQTYKESLNSNSLRNNVIVVDIEREYTDGGIEVEFEFETLFQLEYVTVKKGDTKIHNPGDENSTSYNHTQKVKNKSKYLYTVAPLYNEKGNNVSNKFLVAPFSFGYNMTMGTGVLDPKYDLSGMDSRNINLVGIDHSFSRLEDNKLIRDDKLVDENLHCFVGDSYQEAILFENKNGEIEDLISNDPIMENKNIVDDRLTIFSNFTPEQISRYGHPLRSFVYRHDISKNMNIMLPGDRMSILITSQNSRYLQPIDIKINIGMTIVDRKNLTGESEICEYNREDIGNGYMLYGDVKEGIVDAHHSLSFSFRAPESAYYKIHIRTSGDLLIYKDTIEISTEHQFYSNKYMPDEFLLENPTDEAIEFYMEIKIQDYDELKKSGKTQYTLKPNEEVVANVGASDWVRKIKFSDSRIEDYYVERNELWHIGNYSILNTPTYIKLTNPTDEVITGELIIEEVEDELVLGEQEIKIEENINYYNCNLKGSYKIEVIDAPKNSLNFSILTLSGLKIPLTEAYLSDKYSNEFSIDFDEPYYILVVSGLDEPKIKINITSCEEPKVQFYLDGAKAGPNYFILNENQKYKLECKYNGKLCDIIMQNPYYKDGIICAGNNGYTNERLCETINYTLENGHTGQIVIIRIPSFKLSLNIKNDVIIAKLQADNLEERLYTELNFNLILKCGNLVNYFPVTVSSLQISTIIEIPNDIVIASKFDEIEVEVSQIYYHIKLTSIFDTLGIRLIDRIPIADYESPIKIIK